MGDVEQPGIDGEVVPTAIFSIVVPFYNEKNNIDALFHRLLPVLNQLAEPWEVICVNDGSRDATLAGLAAWHEREARIKVIDLSRNFGKEVALSAGLAHAQGRAVIPMDADLQHPPEIIPEMVQRWREGYDVVYAVRHSRVGQKASRRLLSRGFYWVFEHLTGMPLPREAGDYRLLDRKVVDVINNMPERSRFMKGIFTWVGFRQTGVPYEQEERVGGASKWGSVKLFRFAAVGLTAFSNFPLRVWGVVGATVSLLAFLYIFYRVVRTLVYGVDIPGYESILAAILFMGGMQLLTLGFIGDYLGRVFDEVKGRPLYIIRDALGILGLARPPSREPSGSMAEPARLLPPKSMPVHVEAAPSAQTCMAQRHWESAFLYRDLAKVAMLVVMALVMLNYQDYGITTDEEVQNDYGKMILSWYVTGFKDLSALTYKDLFYYGGLFDFVAAVLNTFSPLGEYETRHLLGGLVGVLGLAGVWKLGGLLAGERAGFLSVILLALTPAYFGPSFNNPKDIPFAVGMAWTLYASAKLVAMLPRPSLRSVLFFATCLGLTLGTRVGGGLAGIYLLLVLLTWVGLRWRESRSWFTTLKTSFPLIARLLPGLPVAWGVMLVFWPWACQSPLNPLVAVHHFTHYSINLETLLDGKWVSAKQLPASYLPTYLLVSLPEVVLVGLLLAAVFAGLKWRQMRQNGLDETRFLQGLLLVISFVLPMLIFLVERPTAYNGIRHFAFLLPSLAVMAAIGLHRLWERFSRFSPKLGNGFAVALTGFLLVQLWIMDGLHPNEYIYYNAIAGGVSGAKGRFELDYWGNSLAEATQELADYVMMENGGKIEGKSYKVAVCGHRLAATYHMPPFLKYTPNPADADFIIAFTQHGCDRVFGGRQIIGVDRGGVDLSVVKDRRPLILGKPSG
ncbi:MAG: glycosyltransferase [Magnetococcales bacterium]|nr:glycosyltransferase [Magnetococcales bacterium]